MRTHARFLLGIAALALSFTSAIACDGLLDFGHRDLTTDPPPSPPPEQPQTQPAAMPIQVVQPQHDAGVDEAPPRTCAAVMVDPAIDYSTMCRHYCDTLEETTRYLLLSRGETPGDAGAVSQQCYQLRCVPRCVDQALCFTQCDAAATSYAAVCANANVDAGADDAVCPSSPDDHLAACRAGCSPPAPPWLG